MGYKKLMLGAIAGLAAGAIVGILLAPDKGSKTREKIMGAGEDLSAELKKKLMDLLDLLDGKKESHDKEETH